MQKGNTNTILLVIVLLILVGGGVYWYTTYGPSAQTEAEPQSGSLEVNLSGSQQ
ncbi:MAG TPA: hypothetical protein VJK53_05060 [Candidatus Paceibacterota bacterium]